MCKFVLLGTKLVVLWEALLLPGIFDDPMGPRLDPGTLRSTEELGGAIACLLFS